MNDDVDRLTDENRLLDARWADEKLRRIVAENERDALREEAAFDHQEALEQAELRRRAEAENARLRAVVGATGDTVAQVLAELDVSDDARTLLLDAIEKVTVALAASGEATDG